MKVHFVLMTVLLVSASLVAAQGELPDPGITPDSPFYFADRLFDVFQKVSSLVDERAAEAIAMASQNHERGLEKALEGYDKAMSKRERQAEGDEDEAEEVARQAGEHLIALARASENVPEAAKQGIATAMARSSNAFDKAVDEINKTNSDRAGSVAAEVLQRVIENAPEAALDGLNTALAAVQRHGPVETALNQSKGKMPEEPGNASAGRKPENATAGMN